MTIELTFLQIKKRLDCGVNGYTLIIYIKLLKYDLIKINERKQR